MNGVVSESTRAAYGDQTGEIDDSAPVPDLAILPELHENPGAGDEDSKETFEGAKGDRDNGSYYWDATTMAPLSPRAAAAIARLRAFKPPPFPLWDRLPVSRRAAVLLLLYPDRVGELRVVITMRAATLRSFSGHAALPGGKADTLEETPYQVARREAWEEIGLPMDDAKLPSPFRIENLCYLPYNLARTELVVRPCVAYLYPDEADSTSDHHKSVDETLIPRLDPKEVAAVFSAPFHNFLATTDEPDPSRWALTPLPPGEWYEGNWSQWHGRKWRMHFFHVPVDNQRVRRPRPRHKGLAALAEDETEDGGVHGAGEQELHEVSRYKVWGMTARILVDAARVAYGEEPGFEHNAHFGDEEMIEGLFRSGRLGEKKFPPSALVRQDSKGNDAPTKM